MKKTYIAILAALFAAVSCSLKEVPSSFVNRDHYYGNVTQCESALYGVYTPLTAIYQANFMLMTEACSDIWYSRSTTVDACLDVTPAKPQFGATVWRQGYLGVMRANECIEGILASELDEKERERYTCWQ